MFPERRKPAGELFKDPRHLSRGCHRQRHLLTRAYS